MFKITNTSGSNHRNIHCINNDSGQQQIITIFGTIPVHTGQQNFPSSILFHLSRPSNSVNTCRFAATINIDFPTTTGTRLGVNSNNNALAAKTAGSLLHKSGIFYCRRVDGNLIRPGIQQITDVLQRPDATTYSQGNKHLFSRPPDHINNNIPLIAGGGNIQEGYFISSLLIIGSRHFHRVSGIPQANKINSFNHPAVLHIQTGDNPFCQHLFNPVKF